MMFNLEILDGIRAILIENGFELMSSQKRFIHISGSDGTILQVEIRSNYIVIVGVFPGDVFDSVISVYSLEDPGCFEKLVRRLLELTGR